MTLPPVAEELLYLLVLLIVALVLGVLDLLVHARRIKR